MKSIMRRNQGFLLLETVIALGLFSLSALSITYLNLSRCALEFEIKQRTTRLNQARTSMELFEGGEVEVTTPKDVKEFLKLHGGAEPTSFKALAMGPL